ncbi:DUF3367 domain-containing protein [Corynebacterium sp. zg254]|uniref:DUF3367 domain-containing protein n=1 Tax=Corynebacterium zhongnanshanii TaxID=2768834 RepID=A0ABQ6VCN7_9CORY|nr:MULTISPECIES: alpha-(1->3)-arabinofuranosyltransferase family protein [Corynebacterium]KAB3519971.1 DUF3367 domain-containing protein [Corynebacterium zhongnanshanii]MCR5914920.1 DUF3367 domain-containing protein [Corynebacterium sp. zg254]
MTRRAWCISAIAWLLLAFLQSPGLTSADTKHDLTANPWGFLHQALSPWTDVFPLGQLQNQAYGYLFPHGLFFAVLSSVGVPGWVAQRLWWALLLFVAFAGVIRLLEVWGRAGFRTSTTSRIIAGVLYALSPRILTTVGAISSEAWVMALAPWVLIPVVCATIANSRATSVRMALSSAVAVLAMGAVNAVATAVAVLPAVVFCAAWLLSRPRSFARSRRSSDFSRRPAFVFLATWIPAGVLAVFWWVGPLLILGRYSPAFTDFIESASLTTRWLNPLEVLRGTTSWTPFLSNERIAGSALVAEPVFIVGTLLVALIGLWGLRGMARARVAFTGRLLVVLLLGCAVMISAYSPLSPWSSEFRSFLDASGAALRNLHKFDPLVRLPVVVGVAYALRSVVFRWDAQKVKHPEKNRSVVQGVAVCLLLAVVTAPAWSLRLAAADAYRAVPGYWQEAADFLHGEVTQPATVAPRTLILPEARFGRQTWGNTRDEPAQPLLDVPWAVRDSVPLVQPEAIRGLDGINEALSSGRSIPTLAATLRSQGVGYLLVRGDLTAAADTPGSAQILRTLERSGGFRPVAEFGDDRQIRIFATGSPEQVAAAGLPRWSPREKMENVAAAPEAATRLSEADAALGRRADAAPRPRIFNPEASPETVTDTPALRDHNYGNVNNADSAIRAADDATKLLNPVRDYPVRSPEWLQEEQGDGALPEDAFTQVQETGGHVRASSAGDEPSSFGGADTTAAVSAAVDGQPRTAWYPAPGVSSGQWLEFSLNKPYSRLGLSLTGQGRGAKLQVTTYLGERVVASTTTLVNSKDPVDVEVPAAEADRIRVTILSSFGSFGIAEATVRSNDDEDITPHRVVAVPAASSTAGTVNRWIVGQELNEGVMTRQFTVDREVPVVVHTDRCADQAEGRLSADRARTVAGVTVTSAGAAPKTYICGDTFTLTPGTHTLSSPATWVALTVAEPLYAAAVSEAPGAATIATDALSTGEAGSVQLDLPGGEAAGAERVLWLPSQANPGREAVAHGNGSGSEGSGGEIRLKPLVVNGWQQGWIIPAGVSGPISVSFTPTSTYHAWLMAGFAGAVVLVAVWLLVLWRTRTGGRTGASALNDGGAAAGVDDGDHAAETAAAGDTAATTNAKAKVAPAVFGVASAVAVIGAARGPWGSASYAGDSWFVSGALLVALAVPYAAYLRARLRTRR